jgi:DNA-3-methyladenine glycosylase II
LTPENFEEFEQKALTQIKISMRKLETLTNLQAFFSKNPVQWKELETSEIQAILGSITGVGPWSIDMILLYTLHRTGIFPAQDFHLKKILDARYPIETFGSEKQRIFALAELWKEHQSVAVLYWLEAKKQKIIKV